MAVIRPRLSGMSGPLHSSLLLRPRAGDGAGQLEEVILEGGFAQGNLAVTDAVVGEAGEEVGEVGLLDLDLDGAVIARAGQAGGLDVAEEPVEALRDAEPHAGPRGRRRQLVGVPAGGD